MAAILGKIFKQWIEEAAVNKLADSKTMQKLAVNVVKNSEAAQQAVEQGMKDPAKLKEGFGSFLDAMKKEIARDLNATATARAPSARPQHHANGSSSSASGKKMQYCESARAAGVR